MNCIFVSDLHGHLDRYQKLFNLILSEKPDAVFLGGDLLPHEHLSTHSLKIGHRDFVHGYLLAEFEKIKDELGDFYPAIFLILGNDDSRFQEASILELSAHGFWHYINFRSIDWRDFTVFGYSYIPPSPFQLKDWEKYDVSRFVDPGSISPEEGFRTVPVSDEEKRYSTIERDLNSLAEDRDLSRSIFLFHSPPYQTHLDRAALDGKMVDHAPLDVHIGSIAIRRFIENRQPLLCLHGHVHESTEMTGEWRDRIGRTHLYSAAHDGPELAVVRFNPEEPEMAHRDLI
ncbi:MAG: metallophosphoesterase [Calditrichaeota bacterium]|nr:metallophosphoesterase [Calditrichota bacterium]